MRFGRVKMIQNCHSTERKIERNEHYFENDSIAYNIHFLTITAHTTFISSTYSGRRMDDMALHPPTHTHNGSFSRNHIIIIIIIDTKRICRGFRFTNRQQNRECETEIDKNLLANANVKWSKRLKPQWNKFLSREFCHGTNLILCLRQFIKAIWNLMSSFSLADIVYVFDVRNAYTYK